MSHYFLVLLHQCFSISPSSAFEFFLFLGYFTIQVRAVVLQKNASKQTIKLTISVINKYPNIYIFFSLMYQTYVMVQKSFAMCLVYLSRIVRKPDFCLCENKGADQLRSNCEADQRLCFRYSDSTIPLLLIAKISSL